MQGIRGGRDRDVILEHRIERVLPNSFGLSDTVEGEPGYCRDHLEMREKDAAVLTEDTGRFGGSPGTPSLALGAEPPLEWMCSSPPLSVTVSPSGLGGQNLLQVAPLSKKKHLTLSCKGIIEQLHPRKLHPHTH